MEFYKTHNVNPAAGCLPFIAQFIVLIALYQVFMHTLGGNGMGEINSVFMFWDLKNQRYYLFAPVLAGTPAVYYVPHDPPRRRK